MTPPEAAVSGAAVALATAAIGSGMVAWSGPLDKPRARGLHQRPVVTSGGVAIVAGLSLGLLVWARANGAVPPGVAASLAFAAAMGLLGALDDLRDLGARFKLIIQALGALAFALLAARIEAIAVTDAITLDLGLVVGALGTALWLVVVANAVNFMDGANGLAPGAVAIASLAFGGAAFVCGAAGLGAAALIGAAALLGLLPWNLGGRLFQGDAGALFSSVWLACLAVIGASNQASAVVPIWTAPLALLPMLTDVLLTLLHRAYHRRPLLDAHREHLYQLWLGATSKPHAALAWRIYLIMIGYGLAAANLHRLPPAMQTIAFALAVVVSTVAWASLRRRYFVEP